MKAKTVNGLHPETAFSENATRIVRTRLAELYSFAPAALDPDRADALHDMRIAAKRLRYALELTSFCFGPYGARAIRRLRELQDIIGAIHDCDVLAPRVRADIATLRVQDAHVLAAAAMADGGEPASMPGARRATYGALEALLIDQQARREVLFAHFCKRWADLERSGFHEKLLAALQQGPADAA
jgi:hypothetical protein